MSMHVLASPPPTTFLGTIEQTGVSSARRRRLLGISDRFADLELLGEGGNCQVYQAWDSEREQFVAIKRMHSFRSNRAGDPLDFENEYVLLKKLASVDVVEVFDFFQGRMFKPYFTMELVEGVNLCRILQGLRQKVAGLEHDYPLGFLLGSLARLARTLHEVHERGIFHLDVKPENIMMTPERGTKIVDWGSAATHTMIEQRAIASQLDSQRPSNRRDRSRNAPKHLACGSPLYMSPEQIDDPELVDGKSDIYSLGAVLYDCLALTPLNPGKDAREAFEFVRRGRFQSPDDVTLRDSIPAEAAQLCMQAIQPDRNERIPDMHTFAIELERCTKALD